jgi:hypothetical protein
MNLSLPEKSIALRRTLNGGSWILRASLVEDDQSASVLQVSLETEAEDVQEPSSTPTVANTSSQLDAFFNTIECAVPHMVRPHSELTALYAISGSSHQPQTTNDSLPARR